MGLFRSRPRPLGLRPSHPSRWALLSLAAGVLMLAPPEARADGLRVPSTTRLPSTTRKGTRNHSHTRHSRLKLRDCPTQRGSSNDQNGNGRDDRCDTGPD